MTPTSLPALSLGAAPVEGSPASPANGLDFSVNLAAAMPAVAAPPAMPESAVSPEAVVPPVISVLTPPNTVAQPLLEDLPPAPALHPVDPVDPVDALPASAVPGVSPVQGAQPAVLPVAAPLPVPPTMVPTTTKGGQPRTQPPNEARPQAASTAEPTPELFTLEADAPRVEPVLSKVTPVLEAAPPPPPGPQALETPAKSAPVADAGPALEVNVPEFEIGARIRTSGPRTARVDVPMADGTMLRAEVSVDDGAVEVTLHGSQEMGAMAVSDAQQLRDGLSEQGLDLAEFEFQAEAEGDEDAEAQGETASEHAGPVDFAPADFDPDDEGNQSALALAAKDPELSRGAFVRRRM